MVANNTHADVVNCLVARNGGHGVQTYQYGGSPELTQCTLLHCTMAYNGDHGVRVDGGTLTWRNNVSWGNANANQGTNPMFVDASAGDYHLKAGSLFVDGGLNYSGPDLPDVDLDGSPRPVDGDDNGVAVVDGGCFEYQGESESAAPLAVSGVTAAPTAIGAEVSFTLSADADVSATVMNLAGRPVRRVTTAKPCTTGRNTVLWNATSDSGLKVPAGMYLMRIEANAPDGSRVQALTPVRLGR